MITVLSDIHGNLPALKAVLNEADVMGCDQIISLGDVTGYYAQPGECLDLLIEREAIQLLGNHDYYLAKGISCPRSRIVSDLISFQRQIISTRQIDYLKTLKPKYDDGDNSFVHGGWLDPLDEYIYRLSETKLPLEGQHFFSGHTHVQFFANIGSQTYCNPGSVGQPRDGNPMAAFATLDKGKINLHRVDYDIDETVHAMRKAGFDNSRLWEGLYIGAQIGGRIDMVFAE